MSTLEPEEPAAPAEAVSAEQSVLDEVEALVDPLEDRYEMDPLDSDRRLLLVHAHPDDETIETGATMARYAADGVLVTLVTCTRGEEGEVVGEVAAEFGRLTAEGEDTLGDHRVGELAAALEALDVNDHRFLGERGRYRDSGMAGTPSADRPDCFSRADLGAAADALVAILREVRPQVVVTSADDGGYGHPDHIQANRVTMLAVGRAADPAYAPERGEPWQPAKVYWTAQPRAALVDRNRTLREADHPFTVVDPDELPFASADAEVTTAVDAVGYREAQMAALRAHATQVRARGACFALSNDVARYADGIEYFRLAHGVLGPARDDRGRETDLFGGIQ